MVPFFRQRLIEINAKQSVGTQAWSIPMQPLRC